jgi:hypothetical protein
VIDEHTAGQQGTKQGDFVLEIYGTGYILPDGYPKNAPINEYFKGINKVTDLGANDVVREFIAENESYWKPFRRMAIVIVLLISLLFLLLFLVIQTTIVWKAIYSSFVR